MVKFNKKANIKIYLVENISFKTSNQRRNIQKKRLEKKRIIFCKIRIKSSFKFKKK